MGEGGLSGRLPRGLVLGMDPQRRVEFKCRGRRSGTAQDNTALQDLARAPASPLLETSSRLHQPVLWHIPATAPSPSSTAW